MSVEMKRRIEDLRNKKMWLAYKETGCNYLRNKSDMIQYALSTQCYSLEDLLLQIKNDREVTELARQETENFFLLVNLYN